MVGPDQSGTVSPGETSKHLVSRLRDDESRGANLNRYFSVTDAQARVTLIRGVPDRPGIAADMFETIGEAGIFIDMIVQGYDGEDGSTSVSFTVDESSLPESIEVAKSIAEKHAMRDVQSGGGIVKATVSGIGLRSHTHVATLLFETLASGGINIEMISTSELQVNAVVDASHADSAKKALEQTFADSLMK